MNTFSKPLMRHLITVLVAAGQVASTRLPAQTSAQSVEQPTAIIEKTKVEEADSLNRLATAVREEKRNDAWAAKKESELWMSSTAEKGGILRGALKSVECRSSKCELELQVSTEESPQVAVEQLIAISAWIGGSQACEYTILTEPGSQQASAAIRIFLGCGK